MYVKAKKSVIRDLVKFTCFLATVWKEDFTNFILTVARAPPKWAEKIYLQKYFQVSQRQGGKFSQLKQVVNLKWKPF